MKDKLRKDSLASDASDDGDKKLQNQFSFVERATQTMNNQMKVLLSFKIELVLFWHRNFFFE